MRITMILGFFIMMLSPLSANAEGAFDQLDPCISAGQKMSSSAAAARSQAQDVETKWSGLTEPPSTIRPMYVQAIRSYFYDQSLKNENAKKIYETKIKEDPNFDAKKYFIETLYPIFMSQSAENELVNQSFKNDYEKNIQPKIAEMRVNLEKQLNEQKDKYDQTCKSDVVNQVIRVVFSTAISPINNSIQGMKNEDGTLNQGIYLLSGISMNDINTKGLFGGENSVVNNALKELNNVEVALKPNTPIIKIGDVCLPWC
ncbi:hypothetical protein [Klebsiella variicola]|uniref:hypothetical protein n=1 Tax=Klebsiella variicola TaxID=244366 RepID=UPI001BACB5D7|nr:hypothetical protein [Klebsiella variicola]MBR8851008.1 hypothetical protein [Klebsiella variicola]MCJ1835998.1 hypothetical protein [Klebsiella variicola subsp. variicola]UTA78186.1 hypothetical protein KGB1_27510 [Klebsiella variicola]HCB9206830.1 hypothetical protein [Klebsiella variicola]HDK6447845.1 hypothetical protein [Klebsiella variicola]